MDFVTSVKMFVRVVECGSFSAVARQSGVAQPTVSKHLSALEEHPGTKLLSRSTRQINLTESGSEFYDRCIRILSEIEEAEASVARQKATPTGVLKVNMPVTYGRMRILPTLWSFLAENPEIKLDLRLDDRYVNLIEEGVDVAIRIGALTDSNMIARKIGESQRITVASPDYLQEHGEPMSIQDLNNHSCIVYSLLTTGNQWHFNSPKGPESTRVTGRFTANSPDAIREAVLAGVGIAVTPTWLVNDCIERGELRNILCQYTPTPLDIHAIYPERRYVPEKVRCFVEHLRETINA